MVAEAHIVEMCRPGDGLDTARRREFKYINEIMNLESLLGQRRVASVDRISIQERDNLHCIITSTQTKKSPACVRMPARDSQ